MLLSIYAELLQMVIFMVQRIGFCCKFVENTPKGVASVPNLNTGTTTVAWLNRQTTEIAERKLWELSMSNIAVTKRLVERVGGLAPELRMVRISSDILPVYTEPKWSRFYRESGILDECEKGFAEIGRIARELDVRLCFHPGQFCVLASATPDIVRRSLEEFEYHVDMARWMGYGATWHDHGFGINVHISGRQGPQGIIAAMQKMTPEARNLLTIENDENSWGLDASLELEEHVALVLDIHHHWIRNAEYIDVQDDRVQRVIRSWRGVRPLLHYSVSREDVLVGHDASVKPDMLSLQKNGHKRQKLRAHSDFYWNSAANDWALTFFPYFDLECESKAKNLASFRLNEYRLSKAA